MYRDVSAFVFVRPSFDRRLNLAEQPSKKAHLNVMCQWIVPLLVRTMDCNGTKCHAECELRHLDDTERSLRSHRLQKPPAVSQPDRPHLVIVAAPERSGSTWLYNAVRLLCRDSGFICDSYWIHTLTPTLIRHRLEHVSADADGGGIVLVKTHEWNEDYEGWLVPEFHPTILLTHRNLVGVVKSYRRVGWAYTLSSNYVSDHMNWRNISSLDLKYEDIPLRGVELLQLLAEHLHEMIGKDVSQDIIEKVHAQLANLDRLPGGTFCGGPNQITKVWPGHVSEETKRLQTSRKCMYSSDDDARHSEYEQHLSRELIKAYPEYMKTYNYSKKA